MGKRSRDKGAAWEREVANLLQEIGFVEAKRNLEEVRSGNSGDVLGCEPFVVQCKVGQRPPIYDAMAQAHDACGDDGIPVAITRRNGAGKRPSDDLVHMRLADWLELVRAAWFTVVR